MSSREPTIELKRIEIEKNLKIQKAKDVQNVEMSKMCQKADRMANDRSVYLLSEKEKYFKNLQRAEEEQSRKSADLEHEQKLAQAMEDLKHQELVDMKNNQLFQTNSKDFRRTERQLQNNLVKNELIIQIEEKKAKQREEKFREYNADLKIIEADQEDKKKDIDLLCQKKQSKSDYMKVITDQIQDAADKRQASLALQLKQSQPTGNFNEPKKCSETKPKTENIELPTKNETKKNERKESDKLNNQIEEYLTLVDTRTKQHEVLKNKKKEEKERIYKHIVDNMVLSDKSGSSAQNIMHSIYEQEQKQNATRLATEKEAESKKRERFEVFKHNELQLKVKNDREKGDKEHDFLESKKILQSVQDYNEAEQKKITERRQKMVEYRNELKVVIDQRADLKNEQKTKLKNDDTTYTSFFSY